MEKIEKEQCGKGEKLSEYCNNLSKEAVWFAQRKDDIRNKERGITELESMEHDKLYSGMGIDTKGHNGGEILY